MNKLHGKTHHTLKHATAIDSQSWPLLGSEASKMTNRMRALVQKDVFECILTKGTRLVSFRIVGHQSTLHVLGRMLAGAPVTGDIA